MKKVLFYINPVSGNHGGEKIRLWLKESFSHRFPHVEYEIRETEKSAENYRIQDEDRLVVAVGGDGTISELIRALKGHSHTLFSFVPLGTGNDFSRTVFSRSRTINNKEVLFDHLDHLINHGIRSSMDIVSVNEGLFSCYFSFGADAKVVRGFSALRRKYGWFMNNRFSNRLVYILLGIRHLFGSLGTDGEIELVEDNGNKKKLKITENMKGVVFSNIRNYGGGAFIDKEALKNDGFFELTLLKGVSDFLLLMSNRFGSLFYRIYRSKVKTYRVKEARTRINGEAVFQMDGEEFAANEKELAFSVDDKITLYH